MLNFSPSLSFHNPPRWNSRFYFNCNRTASQTDDFPSNLLIPLIFREWKGMSECEVMMEKGQHYNLFVTWHTHGNAEYDSVVFAALISTKGWLCQGKPDILNETVCKHCMEPEIPLLYCGFLLKCSYCLTLSMPSAFPCINIICSTLDKRNADTMLEMWTMQDEWVIFAHHQPGQNTEYGNVFSK